MPSRAMLLATAAVIAMAATGASADITISTDSTQNMNCSGGVCAPTAADAVLNVNDLESMLAAGDLTVTTSGSGVQAGNIVLDGDVSWSATTTLVLDAYDSIYVDAVMDVAGPGNLTLKFRDGGPKGAVAYNGGSITFASLSSVLTMKGTVFTLVGDIKTLATDIQAKSSGNFALAAPYDASQDGTYSTVPIPTRFRGSFDALGNTISNLSINDPTDMYVGLFAYLYKGARIDNLNLDNVNINGSYNPNANAISIGAIAGVNFATLSNLSVTGTVTDSASDVDSGVVGGGLVGTNGGNIKGCTSAVAVSAGQLGLVYLGGLAGSSGGAKISGSVATGTVTESSSGTSSTLLVGGAVGNNAGFIDKTHAEGNVSAKGGSVGGLVGGDSGSITRSYATGAVEGGMAGGLIGTSGIYQADSVDESFATGNVNAANSGGGLVGNSTGSVINSYALGNVEGTNTAGGFAGIVSQGPLSDSYAIGSVSGKSGYRGGFAGQDLSNAGITVSYWNLDTSGRRKGTGNRGNEPGIKGWTTTQFQSHLPKGFDSKIWTETAGVNNGFPYLIANPPPQ